MNDSYTNTSVSAVHILRSTSLIEVIYDAATIVIDKYDAKSFSAFMLHV